MAANGFEIHDAFYPLPESFRMGDPVLVEEVTGLTWGEFSDRTEEPENDPAVMLGMLAVAVWQTNPRWRRDRVARFVESLDIGDVKFIGEEADEQSPPDGAASPQADDSTSKSNGPPGSISAITPVSTTQDGLPPTIPVSA